ncbi:MAG: hypothetical protein GAK36_00203 [Pseudomonas sp.]|nr:MAG: hypothetical protein GAK36_00203 [Pseudomonas sp.]
MLDPIEWVSIALNGLQSKLWTALPGIIQSFDANAMTCVIQPAVQALVRDETGALAPVNLPLLLDCPVQFPAGGGVTLTFPVAAGDECLVVFASRCIDAWWQSGGIQAQAELRMHDLSDGFALLGFRSQPRVIAAINTSAAQLRSDDGATFVEVAPGGGVTITAPAGLTINANVQVNGDVSVTGDVLAYGDVKASDISLQKHLTSGVTPGPGVSGAPVP